MKQRMKFVRKSRVKKIRKLLLDKLEVAREILVNKFHAKRIILIGSLQNGNNLHHFSDIDLVVEGLGKDYLKAGGYLIDHIGNCIDLKPFEMLDENFKEHILLTGKVIYLSDD
jgi:predicted nucleotidyltransferase